MMLGVSGVNPNLIQLSIGGLGQMARPQMIS